MPDRSRRYTPPHRTIEQVTSLGPDTVYSPYARKKMAELPPKRNRQHRWIVTAGWTCTDEAAEAAESGDEKIIMDLETLFTFGVGCVDCEQERHVVKGQPCLAPEWKPNA